VAAEPLLIVILGPTASGKTNLSLHLAKRFGGEIVSCDSVALYSGFEIGTAKPSIEERGQAPHHLLDCFDPTEHVTAGEYAREGRRVLSEIESRGKLPIVVGGTGLYLRALLEGLFPGPARSEELRERLRERNPGRLHRVLRKLDANAAANIHENDTPKVIRAIEVCLATRQKMTDLWKRGRDPLTGFRIVRLGLNPERTLLYTRINSRALKMFETGLIEETRTLIEKYGTGIWPLSSLGYKQAAQLIRGEMTLNEAIAAAQQAHRNYAKRQMTWFRREPDVKWIHSFGDELKVRDWAEDIVQRLRAVMTSSPFGIS
jgi:tRNA dimethylallyltransferase